MAEIFGAVASGAGLDASREAPETVRRLCFDLETVSLALRQFEQYRENDLFADELLARSISACDASVTRITAAVGKVDRLLKRSTLFGKVYMGFKEPEVRKLLEEMEHAKSSLILAYVGYCQSWNMRESIRHAASLRQQQEASSVYVGQKDRLQQALELTEDSCQGISAATTTLEAIEHTKLQRRPSGDNRRAFHRQPRSLWSITFALPLPRRLVQCVWEMAIYRSEGMWTAQIYQVNVRPGHALAFDYVRDGNVAAVRELIQSGNLSVRDRRDLGYAQQGLLEIAARDTNIELCSFLLREFPCFRDDGVLRSAFEAFLLNVPFWHLRRMPIRLVDEFYKLFAKEHNMRLENHETGEDIVRRSLQSLLLTETSFQIILAGQAVPLRDLPFDERFSRAMTSAGWPATAFWEILNDHGSVHLAKASDRNGKTALHWAAAHVGHWLHKSESKYMHGKCRNESKSYASLMANLIKSGADLHAVWVHAGFPNESPFEADAFIAFLTGASSDLEYDCLNWDDESLSVAVRWWGQFLKAEGLSVRSYVTRENGFLSHACSPCGNSLYWRFFPTELTILHDSTLALRVVNIAEVRVWELVPRPSWPPGAWPTLHESLYNTITWEPRFGNEQLGVQWILNKTLRLKKRDAYVIRSSLSNGCCQSLAQEGFEALERLFKGAQDDHSLLAQTVARSSECRKRTHRTHSRRRASSTPPPVERLGDCKPRRFPNPARRDLHAYFHLYNARVYAHRCPFDSRWILGLDRSWDEHMDICLRGECHTTTTIHRSFFAAEDAVDPWLYKWEVDLLKWPEDFVEVEIAERFVERLRPDCASLLERAVQRAKEQAELDMVLIADT